MSYLIERLTLVFNAESGRGAAFIDTVRKVLMMDGCVLCALTHWGGGEKSEWVTCRERLGVPVDYLHRDELTDSMRLLIGRRVPCIVARASGDDQVLLGPDDLSSCKGQVEVLERVLRARATEAGLDLPHVRPAEVAGR